MHNKVWVKHNYQISTDKNKLQLNVVHDFLNKSYWSNGISVELVAKSIEHSLCFGLYLNLNNEQIGFARCVTDFATFGYLCDVFVLPPYNGLGLGKWLIETIFSNDELNFKRWSLSTYDAHSLYAKVGFKSISKPEHRMERIGE